MKLAKFREVVAKGEVEFKVKKGVNDYSFMDGEIVVLRDNDGTGCLGFVHKVDSCNKDADISCLYVYEIQRLKKNKRKEKEVQ